MININIDQQDVQSIRAAGQFMTLVKFVETYPTRQTLPIAWIGIHPEMRTVIAWPAVYILYASLTPLQPGAEIVELVQAEDDDTHFGWTYTFDQGRFKGARGGREGALTVVNRQSGNPLIFGLGQPLDMGLYGVTNASLLSKNQSTSFTPTNNVSLFLSSVGRREGVALSQIPSNALNVSLSKQALVAEIGFNARTNSFFLISQPHTSA